MREGVPTVQAALDEWHDDLTLGGQASTARTYRSLLKRLTDWPDTPVCRQLVADALRTRSNNTARTLWAALSTFSAWACDQGYLASSPMARVPLPREQPRVHTYPRQDELRRVYAACKSDRDRVIVRLLLHGLRAGQLLALRWSDLRDDELLIRPQKSSPAHTVALDAETLRLVELQRGSDRIIPIGSSTLRQIVKRLGRDARVPGLHPHAFRHAFGSHAMLAGMDGLVLQALGGWRSGRMVTHYARSAMREAALKRAREVNLTERLLG